MSFSSPSFEAKLRSAQQAHGSDLALLIAPRLARLPLPMQRYDDPFLPFAKAIIAATRDLLCAYVFDFAAYLALGAAGAVALERTVAYAGTDDLTVTVLHGPFAGSGYAEAAGSNAFNVDAVTLIDAADADTYRSAGLGIFVTGSRAEGLLIALDSGLRLRVIGGQVLSAGTGDDFADQCRAALKAQL